MALEIAMDEMAEKLGMDPVEFRIVNDTQSDPENPERKFSKRSLSNVSCGAPRRSDGTVARPAQHRCATAAGWSEWVSQPASVTTC
jgi:xanthine dehydrogenase YagR molybdenum-binding subunit